jgi:hypothetical protein
MEIMNKIRVYQVNNKVKALISHAAQRVVVKNKLIKQ